MHNFKFIGPKFIWFVSIVFNYSLINAQSPDPPIPIETLIGHNDLYFMSLVKRNFNQTDFNYFGMITYTSTYSLTDVDNNFTMLHQFTYDLNKGFALMVGSSINSVGGLSPLAGFQHNYASKKILSVTTLSYAINGAHDTSFFGVYEFKPTLRSDWQLYTRGQLLYIHSFGEASHARSYLYLRAGLRKKSFNFGAGANLDRFGGNKAFRDNYGPFVRWEF
ncbi:MAG: hypothetical protein JXQ90_04615 [Cyclobacteriaceae bacterium]